MNRLVVGLTATAALMSPVASETAFAGGERICVDVNGGAIDATDRINITGIQAEIGVTADGNFGSITCTKLWDRLINDGYLSGDGTKLKVGQKVHGWLGVPYPEEVSSSGPLPTTPTQESCPTTVTKQNQISETCRQAAYAALYEMGFVDAQSRAVKAFQIEAAITTKGGAGYGKLGPKTYSAIMSGSGEAAIEAQRPFNDGFIVDLSDQTLLYFDGGELAIGSLVSSGKAGKETRKGNFYLFEYRSDWLDGWVRSSLQTPNADPAMYLPIGFSSSRSGVQALHGTKNEDKLGTPASSGCIRVADEVQLLIVERGVNKEQFAVVA